VQADRRDAPIKLLERVFQIVDPHAQRRPAMTIAEKIATRDHRQGLSEAQRGLADAAWGNRGRNELTDQV